jgi:hypothetical protein
LTDRLLSIRAGRNVEQSLVGFGVLHYSRGLPVNCEHHGALGFLKVFHEVAGLAPEGRQRLEVFGDVKHDPRSYSKHLISALIILTEKGKAFGAIPSQMRAPRPI